MRSRFLRREDTSTVEEPASRGDGRHCSLCWTGICGTQPQVDQLATPEGAAGHRALPHRRAGRTSRSLHRLRTYDHHLLQLVSKSGIVQDARATRAGAGSRRANGNCCPLAMSMPCSLCRGNWPRSHCRTSGSSTTCSFTRAPRPCLRSLAIRAISVPRSVSSACSTAGISACSFIRMSTASLPPAVWLRIIQAGSPPGAPSSCPSACSAVSSAASSSQDSATPSIEVSSSSTAACCLLPNRAPSRMAASTVPPRLGCLLQAALRRSGACAALSRRLHPSRRHLQLQAGRPLRWQRHLPLARFRARQQETAHDAGCR